MISLYARIAGNYFKPLGFRIAYAIVALWAVLAAWRESLAHDLRVLFPTPILAFFVILPTIFLADMGIVYLKEQLATWQSSLTPHYRRPHLIVGAFFVAIIVLGLPVLFNRIVGIELFPTIALCAVGASVAGWLAFDPSIKTILVFFGTLALFCFPQVQHKLGLMMQYPESFARTILLMLAGSIALFAWIWWQLSRLREEMPQYRGGTMAMRQAPVTALPPYMQIGWLDALAGIIARYPAWRIRARSAEPVDSMLSTVQHRRLISAGGWVPWRLGALWALALLAMLSCINLAFDEQHRMKFVDIAPIVFIISMPAAPIITSSLWMRRGAMLPYELSLPTSRRSFTRQTLLAFAWDHLSCWIGATIACIAILCVANYQFDDRSLWAFEWSDAAVGILFFLSGQLAAMGLIAWTLRFRSTLLSIFTMIIASALTLPPLLIEGRSGITSQRMVIAIVGFSVAGLVVFADAYRRWLRANFE